MEKRLLNGCSVLKCSSVVRIGVMYGGQMSAKVISSGGHARGQNVLLSVQTAHVGADATPSSCDRFICMSCSRGLY